MITPQSLTEQLLFTTIRIVATLADGDTSTGTGFFYNVPHVGGHIRCIVTNKHVVEDAVAGTLRFHKSRSGPGGKSIPDGILEKTIPSFQGQWTNHPSDDVDLCILQLGRILTPLEQQQIYTVSFLNQQIWDDTKLRETLTSVENVLMVGYPNGLWDDVHNLPLVRRGITSSHPGIDFQGKSVTVVDMACYPGSSGSPVCIADEGSYVNKQGTIVGGETRIILLGTLFEGPVFSAEGQVILKQIPTKKSTIPTVTPIMMHLGHIVKAKELLAFEKVLSNS